MSRVPRQLKAGIVAVLALSGSGAGLYYIDQAATERTRDAYVQAVASDTSTSPAVKVAMVMGSYYESSYKHIGTPYIDRLGKGQPLTVCNGITSPSIVAGKYYTPADCYALERELYIGYELYLHRDIASFDRLTPLQQASFMDFLHNKGPGAWQKSSMRRVLMAGYVAQACRQNERWKYGTVKGVSTVLPGLEVRANANADLCAMEVLQ